MDISDHDLRALVRDVVARRVAPGPIQVDAQTVPTEVQPTELHVSQRRLTRLTSADPDGLCLIEPSVRCSHCGYCLSFGH